MLAWLPTYFTDTMNLTISQAAQFSLLPPMAALAASAVAGPLADSLISKDWDVAVVRKTAQCVAFLGPVACLAGASLTQDSYLPLGRLPPRLVPTWHITVARQSVNLVLGTGADCTYAEPVSWHGFLRSCWSCVVARLLRAYPISNLCRRDPSCAGKYIASYAAFVVSPHASC